MRKRVSGVLLFKWLMLLLFNTTRIFVLFNTTRDKKAIKTSYFGNGK
jgi:hypothetical protein